MPKVLVTGAGGGVGQSILKAFQGSSYDVVAADTDPLAAGLYAAPRACLIPRGDAPEFVDRMLELCRREQIKLIFCGIEPELMVLARAAHRFRAEGIVPIVSRPEVIETCDDKLLTSCFLAQHGFPSVATIPLADPAAAEVPLPVVLKPMKGGARSQGMFVVRSREELRYHMQTVECSNYVAQERLQGDEYTCGSITFDGRCLGVIVMRRTLRDGDTYKAFVVNEPAIARHVAAVAEALDPFGPCNFQLRVREGKPYIFEINSRCSGTTGCRALAGFNEPVMTADYVLQGKAPSFQIRELSFLRYWKELVVPNTRIAELSANACLDGDGSEL